MKKHLILALSLLCTGCITLKTKPLSINYIFNEKPGVGYVFGSLTQTFVNKTRSDGFNDKYTSVIYINERLKGSKQSYVASVSGGENNDIDSKFTDLNGTIFLFEIPIGSHQLDHWSGIDAYMKVLPKRSMKALKFNIKEGDLLYLGNIHMNLTFGKNFVGTPVIAEVLPEIKHMFARDEILLKEKYKFLPASIIMQPLERRIWPFKPQ